MLDKIQLKTLGIKRKGEGLPGARVGYPRSPSQDGHGVGPAPLTDA
jgi:hypothetical protein